MNISPFKLERYFARYEFKAPYLLCPSDCEALGLNELLNMADPHSLKLWKNLRLGYTESQGLPRLREEAAKLYSGISPEEIQLLTPEEGIFNAMNVILQPGDQVISTFPGYQSLYQIAESLGCEVARWMPHRKNGAFYFDPQDLEKLLQKNSKLLVINFPHNPSAALPDRETFLQIVKFAEKHDLYLFSDEMYRFLEYETSDRLPSACELYPKSVSLFGMSKSFALAGLRIGWLVTQNKKLMHELSCFKDYTTICCSAPSEILALIALENREKILQRNLDIIHSNLLLLEDFFTRHSSLFQWARPKAGTIAFPEYLGEKNILDFCKRLVEKKGVMLLPCDVYDYPGKFFRLGFGRKNMPEALEKLEEFLQEENDG